MTERQCALRDLARANQESGALDVIYEGQDLRSHDEMSPEEQTAEFAAIKRADGDIYGSEFLRRDQRDMHWQVDFHREDAA